MVLNKRGQVNLFLLLMIAVTMFIIGFGLASAMTTNANSVMTTMDCANESISTNQKVDCGIVDVISPVIIGLIIALAGTVIGAKVMYG